MRRNGRLLIIVGVILGLAAVLLAIVALTGGNDDDTANDNTSPQTPSRMFVVQAKDDIPAHTKLTTDDLEQIEVDRSTIASPDDVSQSVSEVIGFAYADDLVEGQRLLRSRLEVSGIAEELEPGRRAISVPVTRNNLVAGLLRQDDHIDLVYEINAELMRITPTTPLEVADNLDLRAEVIIPPFGEDPVPAPYPYPGEAGSRFTIEDRTFGNPIAKVALQNIRVLRVVTTTSVVSGGSSSSEDESYLVLEVSLEQAELLHMRQTVGTYQVVLRGSSDTDIAETPGINMETLVTSYGLPIPKSVRLPETGAQ